MSHDVFKDSLYYGLKQSTTLRSGNPFFESDNNTFSSLSASKHKYLAISFFPPFFGGVLHHSFRISSFSFFVDLFFDKYNTGDNRIGRFRSKNVLNCPNSSKRIVEQLSHKEQGIKIYSPHKYQGLKYSIEYNSIKEISYRDLETYLEYHNPTFKDIHFSSKTVLLLTVETNKFFSFMYEVFKERKNFNDFQDFYLFKINKMCEEPDFFTLLVDKDFTEREDSKSLYRRVIKHFYNKTEEAKKSIDIKLVNKSYIYKNALSEMIFELNPPIEAKELINKIASVRNE